MKFTTEQSRKKEARRLINLPVAKRPNNVHHKKGTRLEYAYYMVEFKEGLGVFFQHDGKRLYYLGEYPASNF